MEKLTNLTRNLFKIADSKQWARPPDFIPIKYLKNYKLHTGFARRLPQHSDKKGKKRDKDGNYH